MTDKSEPPPKPKPVVKRALKPVVKRVLKPVVKRAANKP